MSLTGRDGQIISDSLALIARNRIPAPPLYKGNVFKSWESDRSALTMASTPELFSEEVLELEFEDVIALISVLNRKFETLNPK